MTELDFNTATIRGHQSKGKERNPIWIEDGLYKMYCEKETICILCPDGYNKIVEFEKEYNDNKKITWFKHLSGYIQGCSKIKKTLYIHQVLLDCYKTNNSSVEYLDKNKLNNTLSNLKIISEGMTSTIKRARRPNAKSLPNGITEDMIEKYVNYNFEWLDKEKTKSREYFTIEKHPKLEKKWIGSKSNNILILDKLNEANNKIKLL
jgi:hypothetical protein